MNQARSRAIDRLRFEQRKKRVNHHADSPLPATAARTRTRPSTQGAGPPSARRLDGSYAGRATGDRDRVLFRVDVCRSGGTAESAARNRQDTNPFRAREAPAGAGWGREGAMSSAPDEHGCEQADLVFRTPCRPFLRAKHPPWRRTSPRVRTAGRRWRRCVRSSTPSFPGRPTCCAHRHRYGGASRSASRRRRARSRCCRRHSNGRSRNGKKWRPASPASCSQPIRSGTASACWYGSRRESTIRLTRHAGVEELHLLHGELWIDDKKLYPGDYNRAEPGTADTRVWSETGCTCVLITSTRDVLR